MTPIMFEGKKFVFRVDASLAIGTGHVIRCLTLADALTLKGATCHFICREHSGHLMEAIHSRGYQVHRLPMNQSEGSDLAPEELLPAHAAWLGSDWQTDAAQCHEILQRIGPEWLVVDHYALDTRWETVAKPKDCRLMVIDDLADRPHTADLLLDQNLGRKADDYVELVPEHCQVLAGPRYALLRPEFAEWREASLARRQLPNLRNILVSMGGVDQYNATGQVLATLANCDLPKESQITVIMGASAPWLEQVRSMARSMPRPTEVVVNVNNMAERMARADLAIGAAGSTSWERCCLGLPTMMVVLAENQRDIAEALHREGAAWALGHPDELTALGEHWNVLSNPERLSNQSSNGAALVDGQGVARLLQALGKRRSLGIFAT